MERLIAIWLVATAFILLLTTLALPVAVMDHRLRPGRPKFWASPGPLVQRRLILRQSVVPALGALVAAVLCNVASSTFVSERAAQSTWVAIVAAFPWLSVSLLVVFVSWMWWLFMPVTEDPLEFVHHFGSLLEVVEESGPSATHDLTQLRGRFQRLEDSADALTGGSSSTLLAPVASHNPMPGAGPEASTAGRRRRLASPRGVRAPGRTPGGLIARDGLAKLRRKQHLAATLAPVAAQHLEVRPRYGVLLPRDEGRSIVSPSGRAIWQWGWRYRRLITAAGTLGILTLIVGWALIISQVVAGQGVDLASRGVALWSAALACVIVCAALTVRLDLLWFARCATAERVCRDEVRAALDQRERLARQTPASHAETPASVSPPSTLIRIGTLVVSRDRSR